MAAVLFSGCGQFSPSDNIPSMLDPRSAPAANIGGLWWIMFGWAMLAFIVVTGILLAVLFRRRRYQPGSDQVNLNAPEKNSWIVFGGVIFPVVAIAVTLFFTLQSLGATVQPGQETDIQIEIIGRQWFWDVTYTNENFSTANEFHIPVGQPVSLLVTSADVIHSFWVPQLHGKIDLIPGRTNAFWIQADEPGIYRGLCAEFCGRQHAKMQFMVIAESEEDYAAWVENQNQPAVEPDGDLAARGQEVFVNGDCAFCHTIRGTEAEGQTAPDLTHFASRETIAAGWLANNRGNLGGWIADPQHIKNGSFMPQSELSSEDLQAILAYLESLE